MGKELYPGTSRRRGPAGVKLHLTVDSQIRFTVPPNLRRDYPAFVRELTNDVVIANPEYAMAEKHGRQTHGIPRWLHLYEYDKQTGIMSLPRGYLPWFVLLTTKHGIGVQMADKRLELESVEFGSRIELRDYQKPAVRALVDVDGGVLVAPAGSGKTVMGLELVARIGQPTLWLTHTRDLAEQTLGTAVEVLGLTRHEIGMVGAGRNSVGKKLTIGIVQKMVLLDRAEMAELAGRFGCVVVDETHHAAAVTWSTIVNQLPAAFRYGLTATWRRADGLHTITERVIGAVRHEVPRSAVPIVTPRLVKVETGVEVKAWAKHEALKKDWEQRVARARAEGRPEPKEPRYKLNGYKLEILSEILEHAGRNELLADVIACEARGHSCLVLSGRVAHCELLAEMVAAAAPDLRTAVIHGKLAKGHRNKILEQMRQGELDILFAVEIAKEGLDVPRLDRLFLVAGGRNEAGIEQKIGRIQRTAPGKTDAVVFDFVDERIPPLRAQYWARYRVYKKLGMVPVAGRRRASG